MEPSAARRLADDFVRTAAFLKREFEGRNATLQFTKKDPNNRVIYVFDSDVIITNCAPWITGPMGDEDNNGYGTIFTEEAAFQTDPKAQDDLRGKAESVAWILANYILQHHKEVNKAPLFQFPHHAIETNNVYRAVRRAVEAIEKIDFRHSDARRAFDLARALALVKHRAKLGAKKEDVRDVIDQIINLITSNGRPTSRRARTLQEWDNYYQLETEYGGIFPLVNAGSFFPGEALLSRAFQALVRANRSLEEDEIVYRHVDHWTKVLSRLLRHNIQADAEALAQLFIVNARLVGTNWKCIFVTGDRTLAKAAYAGLPASLIPEKYQSLGQNFSVGHIRHLWAYVSDGLIEPGREQGFVDLFNGLLAKWSEQLDFSLKALEELFEKTPRPGRYISESSLVRVFSEWDTLTRKSISRRSLEQYERNESLRFAIWSKVSQYMEGGSWIDLQKILQEEIDRIRDRTILSLSDVGVDVIIQAEKLGRRNPPDLFFESLKNTNEIFRKLSVANGYSKDGSSFEADMAKIKYDCHDSSIDGDDRQESHLKFLVLGAAFASAERWLIALGHAKRAIGIIQRSRATGSSIPVLHDGVDGRVKSHMSGREAYFLAAVAQRMLARSDTEFDEAQAYLERSERALKEDHENKTGTSITTARFKCERLAIALSRYYLARSKNPTDYIDPLVEDVYKCVHEPLVSVRKHIESDESLVIQEWRPDSFWGGAAAMWTTENRARYDRSQLRYPSDLTDAEWALIEPHIPPAKPGGNKRTVNLREIANGLMYILSTGCQWRAIPKDLPPRATLHDYFALWNWDGTLDRIHHALYVECRERAEREASPTAAIIDSQSVKSAEKGGLASIRMATMQARRSRARSGTFSSTRRAS